MISPSRIILWSPDRHKFPFHVDLHSFLNKQAILQSGVRFWGRNSEQEGFALSENICSGSPTAWPTHLQLWSAPCLGQTMSLTSPKFLITCQFPDTGDRARSSDIMFTQYLKFHGSVLLTEAHAIRKTSFSTRSLTKALGPQKAAVVSLTPT